MQDRILRGSLRRRNSTCRLRLVTTIILAAAPSLVSLLGTSARAQSYTLTADGTFNGANGQYPAGTLTLYNGNLYGTTEYGGDLSQNNGMGDGTVFEINAGTNAITTVADFEGTNNGSFPTSLTVDASGNLYGTTALGGSDDDGTVFKIAAGSSTIDSITSFTGANGAIPETGVIIDGSGNLYGTTDNDGANGFGTVFKIAAGTTTVTTLDSFTAATPMGLVMDSSGNLYGTTQSGGDLSLNNGQGEGMLFKIAAGTTTIQTLLDFNEATNGEYPTALTIDSKGNLYGATQYGGDLTTNSGNGLGTVFEVAAGTSTLTTIASFNGASTGGHPVTGVTVDSSGNIFGTTDGGPDTVYEIAAGSGTISTLHTFSFQEGVQPMSPVVVDSSGNIYGTNMQGGGANSYGTVYELSPTHPGFVWNGAGADNNASTNLNWTGALAPGPAANADITFAGAVRLSPNLEQPYSVDSVTFAANAGQFTLGGSALTVGSGGITQNSATSLQTITTSGLVLGNDQAWNVAAGGLTVSAPISGSAGLSLTTTGGGVITFTGSNTYSGGTTILGGNVVVGDGATHGSSLGAGDVAVDNGSTLTYTASSSAGASFLNLNINDTSSVVFQNNATAGKASINLGGTTSSVLFTDNASAGSSTINNDGTTSQVSFQGSSTAGNATINNNTPGGYLQFSQNASAGSATINSSGSILFNGSTSTLGTSTITLTGNGAVSFDNTTSGGATIVDNAGIGTTNSSVDVSQGSVTDVSLGSLSGAGNVGLGSHTLTLGALNENDAISGVIQDAGGSGATGGSLVKVGSGTLILSGANTYTGTTTVESGTLGIEGSGKYGTLISTGAGSTLDINSGTIAESRALNNGTVNIFGGTVAIDASTGGTVNVYSGAIVGVVVGDPATINIYGGEFSSAIVNADPTQSDINLFGSNFTLTDATIDGSNVDWLLIGTLEDGESLDTHYVEDGASNTITPEGITFNAGASAPEPAALALLAPTLLGLLGTAAVRRRRRLRSG